MTPFEIRILLHYYTRTDDAPEVADNPPVWAETRARFLADGLLERAPASRTSPTYAITDRGRVYCEALQEVPLPIQAWVMEWGRR